MFRIHFDYKVGRFVIQVKTGSMFWSSVQVLAEDNESTKPITFETYDKAIAHIKAIGLDRLYKDKSISRYHEFLTGQTSQVVHSITSKNPAWTAKGFA